MNLVLPNIRLHTQAGNIIKTNLRNGKGKRRQTHGETKIAKDSGLCVLCHTKLNDGIQHGHATTLSLMELQSKMRTCKDPMLLCGPDPSSVPKSLSWMIFCYVCEYRMSRAEVPMVEQLGVIWSNFNERVTDISGYTVKAADRYFFEIGLSLQTWRNGIIAPHYLHDEKESLRKSILAFCTFESEDNGFRVPLVVHCERLINEFCEKVFVILIIRGRLICQVMARKLFIRLIHVYQF